MHLLCTRQGANWEWRSLAALPRVCISPVLVAQPARILSADTKSPFMLLGMRADMGVAAVGPGELIRAKAAWDGVGGARSSSRASRSVLTAAVSADTSPSTTTVTCKTRCKSQQARVHMKTQFTSFKQPAQLSRPITSQVQRHKSTTANNRVILLASFI